MPNLKSQILELGFTESYALWDSEGEYKTGEALVKNGLTVCLRGDDFTMFNRWTGKFLISKKTHDNLINEIKRHLN